MVVWFVVGAVIFTLVLDADSNVVVLLVSALSIVDGVVSVETCVVSVIGIAAIIPNARNSQTTMDAHLHSQHLY